MKHYWATEMLDAEGKPGNERPVMLHRWRICAKCGAKQMRDAEHNWGRVVGYRWNPPAGRCRAALAGYGGAK